MHKKQRDDSLRAMIALSALAAIGIILGKFLAINITDSMRFSFENTTIIFAGIVFGPVAGALLGAVQDLVGCLAVGYAINPIITLGCVAIGAISGTAFKLLKRLPLSVNVAISTMASHVIGSVIIKSVGLSVFYSMPLGVTMAWRTLNYLIVGTAEIILLCMLLKSQQLLTQINKISGTNSKRRFKSVADVSNYAKSVSGVFSKPGLERVNNLLRSLGSPQTDIKVVHVTGTNGKGSTSAMLVSILKASGLKVGSFNSPYLIEMRESIRINGEPISEDMLVSLFDNLRPIAEAAEDKPTEFELLTAAAYLFFKEEHVDVAVIECGMGARRDATNVINSPLLSIITGISMDHTAYLGTTLMDIAKEKAGVIKREAPVLIGEIDNDALEYITTEAKYLSAPIHTPSTPVVKEITQDGTIINCGELTDVIIPLLGTHQAKNASMAISAANILKKHFPSITNDTISTGISDTVWHGRFEKLSDNPTFIFDGAHNLDGVKSAVKSIKAYFSEPVICLTGVLGDKEYEAMADEISTVAEEIITISPDSPRALSAEKYAAVFSEKGLHATAVSSIPEGVQAALDVAKERAVPIVCLGSLYLYKDVKCALEELMK